MIDLLAKMMNELDSRMLTMREKHDESDDESFKDWARGYLNGTHDAIKVIFEGMKEQSNKEQESSDETN